MSSLSCFALFTRNGVLFVFDREEVKEMMNKKKTGSETLAAYEEHLNQVPLLMSQTIVNKELQ